MKIQQWQLRKITEPRTLADVESSRESPVLCWSQCGGFVAPMWQVGRAVWRETQRLEVIQCYGLPEELDLYTQPSLPTRLEDVPDRRVIYSKETDYMHECLWFREDGKWIAKNIRTLDEFRSSSAVPPKNWQITDSVVELVETEVGVLG